MVMDVLVYAKSLLEHGRTLAKEGKFEIIVPEIFSEPHCGHLGWTTTLGILYDHPKDEEELQLRNAFTQLLNATLSGIKDVTYPNASAHNHPILLVSVDRCIELLGKSASDEFVLWRDAEFSVHKPISAILKKYDHPKVTREYSAIRNDGYDHLTIAEHLNALEVKLLGELVKNRCKERIYFPFAPKPERDIDMRECPAEIRPSMREFWELLQAIRRVKKSKLD
jgi:hypothetical protein